MYLTITLLSFSLQPVPLFAKIETSTVEQLKKRFAGRQQTPPKTVPTVDPAIDSLDKMEAAVQKQVLFHCCNLYSPIDHLESLLKYSLKTGLASIQNTKSDF